MPFAEADFTVVEAQPDVHAATMLLPPMVIDPARFQRWTLGATADRVVTLTMDFVSRR